MITKTTKLTTFLTAAVISLAATSSFAEPKLGKTYGDWTIACEKNEQVKKTICYLQQILSTTDEKSEDKKQVQVAAYQFSYADKKELKLFEILPQGVLLQPGTALVTIEKVNKDKEADQKGKLVANGKFTVCQNNTCVAVADVSSQDLNTVLSSELVTLGIFNGEGKQANIPFSTKGLKEGLAALKAK